MVGQGVTARLQRNQEIMAKSHVSSPPKQMPGGQRFSHYKDWIGSLQPSKYFSRNSYKNTMNNTTSLLHESHATTNATPGIITSSQPAVNATNMHPAVFQRRNLNRSANLSE